MTCTLAVAQDDTEWNSPRAIRPESSRVETNNRVEISANIPGKIDYLHPNARGEVVTAGQEILRLDSSLTEAQYEEAKAKAESTVLVDFAVHALAAAELKLKTKKERNDRASRPVFSEDEMRQFELEVVKATAELKKAREDKKIAELARITKETELEQYSVKSTISGIVTETHKKVVGSAVRQGDPVITIVNFDVVHAVLTVSPQYESRINIGDTVLVRKRSVIESRGDRSSVGPTLPDAATFVESDDDVEESEVMTFRGTVSYIGPSNFDEENLMEVEARIENVKVSPGKYMLREGSFIDARILSP